MIGFKHIKNSALGLSAAGLIAAPTVMLWEGVRYEPYSDVGGVQTVCYGHTGDDIEDKRYTHKECLNLLYTDLGIAETAVNKSVKVNIEDETKAALISFTFNVGVGAFNSSTLLRLLNEGDIRGACNQLSRWVFVKKVAVNGLVNRRISEKALCLKGVKKKKWWDILNV